MNLQHLKVRGHVHQLSIIWTNHDTEKSAVMQE